MIAHVVLEYIKYKVNIVKYTIFYNYYFTNDGAVSKIPEKL